MSKTIDDILTHEEMWAETNHPKFKQALYELFKAEAEEYSAAVVGIVEAVPLDTIAKLLGVTNADQ